MSSKYNFKLETLLKVRENEEKVAKKSFYIARNEKKEIEETLDNLEKEYKENSYIDNTDTVFMQRIKKNYLVAVKEKKNIALKQLDLKERELKRKKEELLKASIKVKSLENLKAKNYLEVLKKEKHDEEIQNNEYSLNMYLKKISGGE